MNHVHMPLPDDPVLVLREARRSRGLSQKELAKISRIHEKTISSFETGARIDSLKLRHLRAICDALGISVVQFLIGDVAGAYEPPDYREQLRRWMDNALAAGANLQELAEAFATVYAERHNGRLTPHQRRSA